MRIRPLYIRSMQGRLTAWVAAVVVLSAAVIFVVVYNETGNRLSAEIDRDLRGDAVQLSHALAQRPGRSPAELLAQARGYVRAQPYGQASALLFVIIPGLGTTSNHPELFGSSRPEGSESAAVQQSENAQGSRLLTTGRGYSTRDLSDVGDVRLYELRLRIAGSEIVVGAGQSLAIVSRSQQDVARSFALAGAIALLLAVIASYLVGARVSAPLRRLAALAARVDAGELQPRMKIEEASSGEVRVLAEAFNHMLDRLATAFAAQRDFVADASHELRTPLTVMRGQLELLAAERNPSHEEMLRVERLVQTEISRVSRLVDDLLLLAQSERSDFLRPQPIELGPFITDLWDGLRVTAVRNFELGDVPPVTLLADPDRLTQVLRNLARNAIEHTVEPDGLVALELALVGDDRIRFAVIDDGPGIPPAERERIFERFHRTDSSRSRSAGGTGLGLAIVLAIVEAHRGSVRARTSPQGGAQIEFELPGVVSAPQRRASVESTPSA